MLGRSRHLAVLTQKRRAEVVGEVDAPKTAAIKDAQALKLALAGLRIDAVAINSWCATRPGRTLLVLECIIVGRAPKLLGIARLQRVQRLLAGLVVEIENLSASDDRRSETFSNLDFPDDLRLSSQAREKGRARRNVPRARRPTPLRPVLCAQQRSRR